MDSAKKGEGQSSAHKVQKRNSHSKNKGKNKPVNTTTFKKKKNKVGLACFACGKLGHFSKGCPDCVDRKGKVANNGSTSKDATW